MAISVKKTPPAALSGRGEGITHPVVHRILVAVTVGFLTVFILLPVANIFVQALSKGPGAYVAVFHPAEPANGERQSPAERRKLSAARAEAEKTLSAIRLSVGIAAIVVPLNIIFG